MVINTKLMIPAMSIDRSMVTEDCKWGTSSWSMDDVIGVSLDDNFKSGRQVSRVVLLNAVAKLKWEVMLINGMEYLRCSCFWSMHLSDQSPESMIHAWEHDKL